MLPTERRPLLNIRTWVWQGARTPRLEGWVCSPHHQGICKEGLEKTKGFRLQSQNHQTQLENILLPQGDQKKLRKRRKAPQPPAVRMKMEILSWRTEAPAHRPQGTPLTRIPTEFCFTAWRARELSSKSPWHLSLTEVLFCLHLVFTFFLSFFLQHKVGPVGKKASGAIISGLSIYPTFTLRESQCNDASWNKPWADRAAGHPGLDWAAWTEKVCSPHPLPARHARGSRGLWAPSLWPCPSGLRQWAGEGRSDWLEVGDLP